MDNYLGDLDSAYDRGYQLGLAHGMERAAQYADRAAASALTEVGQSTAMTVVLNRITNSLIAAADTHRERVYGKDA